MGVVERGATLAALQSGGLRLPHPNGTQARAAVRASDDRAALDVQDLMVIAVKAPALPDVARRIAPLLGPRTVVLTA